METSNCCNARILLETICSKCMEHCEPIEEEEEE